MLQDKLAKAQGACRDLEGSYKALCEEIQKLPETERTNREKMKTKFNTDLRDVMEKIVKEEEEAEEFDRDTQRMKADMQIMIDELKAKEEEFWEKVKQSEEDQKADT